MNEKMKKWLKAALIRAARTFCQGFGGAFSVEAITAWGDLPAILSNALLIGLSSAIISLVMSGAGLPEVEDAES